MNKVKYVVIGALVYVVIVSGASLIHTFTKIQNEHNIQINQLVEELR